MSDSSAQETRPKGRGRTRAYKGYSHNGCSRCKGQRIRCDEQKPSCGRCTRAGAKCPGYEAQFRWSTKYEVFGSDVPKRPRQKKSRSSGQECHLENGTQYVAQTAQVGVEQEARDGGTASDVNPSGNTFFDDILFDLPEMTSLSDFFTGSPSGCNGDVGFLLSDLSQNTPIYNQDEGPNESTSAIAKEGYQLYSPETNSPTNSFTSTLSSNQSQASIHKAGRLPQSIVSYNKPVTVRITQPSPSKSLCDSTSILVEFYFKETAQLFSCYDSSMNPFRTTVSRLWDSSPLLYKTLSSMAAASLVEDFPQLGTVGRQLRKEAIQLLEEDTSSELDSLLAMLMLGGSASWHDSRDLGLSFFNRVQRKLASISATAFEQNGVDYHFFHQSMTYWEMLLSYVAENDDLDPPSEKAPVAEGCVPLRLVPHPWTGFARDTQNAVQKVGRLIRKQRKIAFSRCFTSLAHIKQLERDMATASELEQYLSSLSHPAETTVLDPDDKNTPVWHLLTLAEAYRSAGLIQLYHIFPDLLSRRLAREGILDEDVHGDEASDMVTSGTQIRAEWLTTYAVQVLNLMKSIPIESGTRDFQPFILVSLSSELRIPPQPHSVPGTESGSGPADELAGLTSNLIEVSRMRHFVKSRLSSFLHILPPKPIHVCLDIVNTTWKMMDEREGSENSLNTKTGTEDTFEEVYWMDVMIENGWETTMA